MKCIVVIQHRTIDQKNTELKEQSEEISQLRQTLDQSKDQSQTLDESKDQRPSQTLDQSKDRSQTLEESKDQSLGPPERARHAPSESVGYDVGYDVLGGDRTNVMGRFGDVSSSSRADSLIDIKHPAQVNTWLLLFA